MLLTKQTLSLISGFVSESSNFLRDKGTFLRYIKVLHGLNRPYIKDLQSCKLQSSSGTAKILYLSDIVHAYAVTGGQLSGKVKDVLERSCKASAQVIESLDSIANGRDCRWQPFSGCITT